MADTECMAEFDLTTGHAHTFTSCDLSDEELERFLMGCVMDKAELSRMEEHLAHCPAWTKRAEWLADNICTMKEAQRLLAVGQVKSLN